MRIKCPHCGGKGFSEINSAVNMTCGWCMGQGELDIEVVPAKENMTNEEWFCSLPTQEKAKWLENKMTWAAQEQGTFTAKGWAKWLKGTHHHLRKG